MRLAQRAAYMLLSLLGMVAVLAACSDDDDYTLSGYVFDAATGRALNSASVAFAKRATTTNYSGYYVFHDILQTGRLDLTVDRLGYDRAAQSVRVDAGRLDFWLAPTGTGPTVTVTATPTPAVALTPINFTATAQARFPGGTITNYEWDFDEDGLIDSTGSGPTSQYVPGRVGDLRVAVRVTDSRRAVATAWVTVPVVTRQLPSLTATATPTTARPGQDVRFTGVYNPGNVHGPAAEYAWDFDGDGTSDQTSATTPEATFAYTDERRYTAQLRVRDTANRTLSTTVQVEVVTPGRPTVTASANPTAAINGLPVSLGGTAQATAPGATIERYEWDFDGDGTIDRTSPTTADATHTFLTDGTYAARLKATDSNGQTGEATVSVTVTTPPPPTVSATATPPNPLTGATVDFGGSATANFAGGTIVLYEWDLDGDGTFDVSSPTTPTTARTYGTAGAVTAVLRVTDNRGATNTDSVAVTVRRRVGGIGVVVN